MNATNSAGRNVSRERLLVFQGGCNFRDIGGYSTADGRQVRWGNVYRAGVLSYFTSDDHAPLNRLGVRAICDLRRAEEREREPTRWPDIATTGLSWDDGSNMPTIRAFAAQRPGTAAGMRAAMIDLYHALPVWMGPRIRGLFDCVATGQLPVVVHCAAGKDRTGVAIAVLLSALGVSQADIVADYLLTNNVGSLEAFIESRRNTHLGLADAHQPLLAMPADVREVLFAADADYLHAALTHIDAMHGGMDSYLHTVVGLDDATLARVRNALLTGA